LETGLTSYVDVKGVAKVFPIDRRRRLHAVDRVSFTICEGEALGVVGESGSGKSTLARMVAGLIPPDAGSIFLDGRDIGAESRSARAEGSAGRGVQFVFQDVGDALNPAFSARRNIAVGLGRLRLSRDIAARVDASARAVGLTDELLGRPPHQLSGGSRLASDWRGRWCRLRAFSSSMNRRHRSTFPCRRRF
jgi:peptide/nickel transport system ATP-binding protein